MKVHRHMYKGWVQAHTKCETEDTCNLWVTNVQNAQFKEYIAIRSFLITVYSGGNSGGVCDAKEGALYNCGGTCVHIKALVSKPYPHQSKTIPISKGYTHTYYKLHDINWSVCDARSNGPQLMSCNYFVGPWPLSSSAYPMITYIHPVAGNLPIKTLVARQLPPPPHTHTHRRCPNIHAIYK